MRGTLGNASLPRNLCWWLRNVSDCVDAVRYPLVHVLRERYALVSQDHLVNEDRFTSTFGEMIRSKNCVLALMPHCFVSPVLDTETASELRKYSVKSTRTRSSSTIFGKRRKRFRRNCEGTLLNYTTTNWPLFPPVNARTRFHLCSLELVYLTDSLTESTSLLF